MKRSTPTKWIEAAEARAVCELAMAERGAVTISQSPDAGETTRRGRFFEFLWQLSRRGAAAPGAVKSRPASTPTP